MKKFCKDIGLDKNALLNLLLGPANSEKRNREVESSGERLNDSSKNFQSIGKDSDSVVNTGKAAQLAYNNIVGGTNSSVADNNQTTENSSAQI